MLSFTTQFLNLKATDFAFTKQVFFFSIEFMENQSNVPTLLSIYENSSKQELLYRRRYDFGKQYKASEGEITLQKAIVPMINILLHHKFGLGCW